MSQYLSSPSDDAFEMFVEEPRGPEETWRAGLETINIGHGLWLHFSWKNAFGRLPAEEPRERVGGERAGTFPEEVCVDFQLFLHTSQRTHSYVSIRGTRDDRKGRGRINFPTNQAKRIKSPRTHREPEGDTDRRPS